MFRSLLCVAYTERVPPWVEGVPVATVLGAHTPKDVEERKRILRASFVENDRQRSGTNLPASIAVLAKSHLAVVRTWEREHPLTARIALLIRALDERRAAIDMWNHYDII
jgi:hypothetical protein